MTDRLSDEDLDRLAELELAATDGPWVAEVWPVVRSMRAGRRTEGEVSVISSDGLYGVMEGPDAEFIAEMRNAAPALIERVKTAEAERDALAAKIEQVRTVLAHEPSECLEHPEDDPVTCGWKYDIRRIRGVVGEEGND